VNTEISLQNQSQFNVSWKCIPYIYYSLAEKWALVVVEKYGLYNL